MESKEKTKEQIAKDCAKLYHNGELIALMAMESFSGVPILKQGGWNGFEPNKEEYCLVYIPHPQKIGFIVARWNVEQKCFISEETGKIIEKFDCWKRII